MVTPTPSELEILNVLWKVKEATTQTVNTQLNVKRSVGYTTTLKTMQIMVEKGLLDRRKEGKSHIYFPLIQESEAKGNLLDKFVKNTFGGSAGGLMMQLLGKHDVTQAEIDEVKAFIKEMENKDHG
ncbi:MAG: BlaI/MecI/CopY family transcriptional regulator [Flavobacteriaceae bacterium]|nr:BlaI/MecI/CopY family transcriptional regulator [Flavobacteriaceae bacterium]